MTTDTEDFGNELIFACAGVRQGEPGTTATFEVTWDAMPMTVSVARKSNEPAPYVCKHGCERDSFMDELDRLRAELAEAREEKALIGWIVGNGSATMWRAWIDGNPQWTTDRDAATRYARREDAEAVHAEDEDAWRVVPYEADEHRSKSDD